MNNLPIYTIGTNVKNKIAGIRITEALAVPASPVSPLFDQRTETKKDGKVRKEEWALCRLLSFGRLVVFRDSQSLDGRW